MPRHCLAAVLALLLTACSSLGARWQAPALSFVDVQLVRGSLLEQRMRVRLKVDNPNDRPLAVRGASYIVEVAGEELGRGVSGNSFVVPARGGAEFDLLVTANLAPVLLKVATRLGSSKEIPYRLHGEVRLASGLVRSVPFDQRGALRLP